MQGYHLNVQSWLAFPPIIALGSVLRIYSDVTALLATSCMRHTYNDMHSTLCMGSLLKHFKLFCVDKH